MYMTLKTKNIKKGTVELVQGPANFKVGLWLNGSLIKTTVFRPNKNNGFNYQTAKQEATKFYNSIK